MRTSAYAAAIGAIMVLWCPPRVSAQPVRRSESHTTRRAIVQLDPTQTRVDFFLPGELHDTYGRFTLMSGNIEVDPITGAASGSIVIDAASEDSSEKLRDAITKNAVLEVNRYPEVIFEPQRVAGNANSRGAFYGEIEGIMRMHGNARRVTVQVHGDLSGEHVNAACDFLIPYQQWGVESPGVLSSKQIVDATKGVGARMFPLFAYILPVLRKIPPNIFAVSDFVEIRITATGRIVGPSEPRRVAMIVPSQ
jgi:polyisoprenoid-binding protein YceI